MFPIASKEYPLVKSVCSQDIIAVRGDLSPGSGHHPLFAMTVRTACSNRLFEVFSLHPLISPLRRPSPSHNALRIYGPATRCLPPTPTFRRPIPDSLLPSQLHNIPNPAGCEDLTPTGRAESPLSVQLWLRVDYDIRKAWAAHIFEPGSCVRLRGMRDGDELDAWAMGGGFAKRPEILLCDWNSTLVLAGV